MCLNYETTMQKMDLTVNMRGCRTLSAIKCSPKESALIWPQNAIQVVFSIKATSFFQSQWRFVFSMSTAQGDFQQCPTALTSVPKNIVLPNE